MKPDELSRKSRGILQAVVEGHSCQQILARDHTLTYHDIFRAAGEVSTSHWKKHPANGAMQEWLSGKPVQTLGRQRID
jgi:hypothetical protein